MGWGISPSHFKMANNKDIVEWYDHWHIKNGLKSWRPYDMYPSYLEFLGENPEGKLLDLGSGTGFLLRAANKIGLETYGMDISPEGVKIARRVSPESEINIGSMETIKGKYNYITALGSLEHCRDIEKATQSIYDALLPGGKFIAMVPNSQFIGFEFGKGLSIQDEIAETRKSLDEWMSMFEIIGFNIKEITYDDAVIIIAPLDRTYQFIFVMEKNNQCLI
jgi:SAM-dependent methyltransferase